MSQENGQAPIVTAVAQGAVNFDAGLIKQDAQVQMEAANAAPEKPHVVIGGIAAATAPVSSPVVVIEAPAINTIEVLPFVTLSYGNPYMSNLKELKAVTLPVGNGQQETYNFYNPFMRANPAKHLSEGVLRRVFSKIVSVISQVKDREVIYLGQASEAHKIAEGVAHQLVAQIERKFPLSKTEGLMELETDDGIVVLKFGDLFAVNSWVSSVTDDESGTISSTINLNIAVNAGAFYDSQEPHVFIERAVSFVQNMLTKLEAESVNPYIGVAINSESLQDPIVRELLDLMLSPDMGFSLVSRNSVVNGKETWIGSGEADKLFTDNTDILLFAHAFPEEDELEQEEEVEQDEDDEEEDDGE